MRPVPTIIRKVWQPIINEDKNTTALAEKIAELKSQALKIGKVEMLQFKWQSSLQFQTQMCVVVDVRKSRPT